MANLFVPPKFAEFDLTSVDSNAFSLMGNWKVAAREAGFSKQEIDSVIDKCMSGNYDNLVATLMDHSE